MNTEKNIEKNEYLLYSMKFNGFQKFHGVLIFALIIMDICVRAKNRN